MDTQIEFQGKMDLGLDQGNEFGSAVFFFQNQLFQKIIQEYDQSECQTVWTLIRPNILSGLVWAKTVCKSYQQATQRR